jgi:hypothetical protein
MYRAAHTGYNEHNAKGHHMKYLCLFLLISTPALGQTSSASQAADSHVASKAPASSRFLLAKLAIAEQVQKQMQAREDTCKKQPAENQDLCAKWAEAGNDAALDIQATAFAEIDKLAAAQ